VLSDPRLPGWVARHPVKWGIAAGAGAFFVVGLLNGLYIVGAVIAPVFGFANWFVWRRGGPAHRWRAAILRRFPAKSK
jgi:hypothetical protein